MNNDPPFAHRFLDPTGLPIPEELTVDEARSLVWLSFTMEVRIETSLPFATFFQNALCGGGLEYHGFDFMSGLEKTVTQTAFNFNSTPRFWLDETSETDTSFVLKEEFELFRGYKDETTLVDAIRAGMTLLNILKGKPIAP